jgi:RNA polymerase sigma-70 factor, ECF subfamily
MDNRYSEFSKVYEAFRPKILRYLIRLVGEVEAEDLTQEVFIKADRARMGFRGEASLSTWLYRIATNLAYDRYRSPSFRRCTHIQLDEDPAEGKLIELIDCDPYTREKTLPIEQQLVKKEMGECILKYIGKLPASYRMVLLLRDMEELSNKEIAEILGITLDTVKIRLHRARTKLKEEFETHCEYYWVSELSWRVN